MWGLMTALVASLLSSSPGGLEILTIDTGDDWANSTISAIPGHNVTTITADGIGGIDFTVFDVLYVTDAFDNPSTPTWASELIARGPDIDTYINGGGFVIVGVEAFGGGSTTNGDEYNFLPSGLVDGQPVGTTVVGDDVVITDPTHPLFEGITSADLSNWKASYHGLLPEGTLPVLATDPDGQVLIRGGRVGAGGVFVWSLDPDWHHFNDAIPGTLALVENAIGLVKANGNGECPLIASDNSSQAIDEDPGICVLVKTLKFNLASISNVSVLFDLGHSHGCCHHTSLVIQLDLDGETIFTHEDPFVPGSPGGCENTQDFSTSLGNVAAGAHTLEVFLCDEGLSCLLEVYACAVCSWDLDGDGTVGVLDLLALVAAWYSDPGGQPDFNADGTVDILDLLKLLAKWGPCNN